MDQLADRKLDIFREWEQDERYKNLTPEQRAIVAGNFFDKNVPQDKWGSLTDDVKAQTRKNFIDAQLSDTPEPKIEKPIDVGVMGQKDQGLIESGFKGLIHGTLGLGESVGAGVQYLGGRLDSETLKTAGETTAKFWGEKAKGFEAPKDLQGSVLRKPELLLEPSWWAYNVADMAPSLAAAIIPGAGAVKYVKIGGEALRLTPQIVARMARLAGSGVGGFTGGALEGTSTYREVLERGGTEQEAARAAELMTAASGLLNAVSLDKILSPAKKGFLKRFLISGSTEGITEYLEEPAEVGIKKVIIPDKFSNEDAVEQLIQGLNVIGPAFVTGGVSGAISRPDGSEVKGKKKPAKPTPEQVMDLINTGMTTGKTPTGETFTPAQATAVIKEAHKQGIIGTPELEALKENHPSLSENINTIAADQAAERVRKAAEEIAREDETIKQTRQTTLGNIETALNKGTLDIEDVRALKLRPEIIKLGIETELDVLIHNKKVVDASKGGKPGEELKAAGTGRGIPQGEEGKVPTANLEEGYLKQEAEKNGVTYNGVQKGVNGERIPLFTDNETKSTFGVDFANGQTIEEQLEKTRERFKASEKGEPLQGEGEEELSHEEEGKRPQTADELPLEIDFHDNMTPKDISWAWGDFGVVEDNIREANAPKIAKLRKTLEGLKNDRTKEGREKKTKIKEQIGELEAEADQIRVMGENVLLNASEAFGERVKKIAKERGITDEDQLEEIATLAQESLTERPYIETNWEWPISRIINVVIAEVTGEEEVEESPQEKEIQKRLEINDNLYRFGIEAGKKGILDPREDKDFMDFVKKENLSLGEGGIDDPINEWESGWGRERKYPFEDEDTSDTAKLYKALHNVSGAELRWERLKKSGATDEQILEGIRIEFGIMGGSSVHGGEWHKGGKKPVLFRDHMDKKPFLEGQKLIDETRKLLEIPKPGKTTLTETTPAAGTGGNKEVKGAENREKKIDAIAGSILQMEKLKAVMRQKGKRSKATINIKRLAEQTGLDEKEVDRIVGTVILANMGGTNGADIRKLVEKHYKVEQKTVKAKGKIVFNPDKHSLSMWVKIKGGIKEADMTGEVKRIREQPGGIFLFNNKTGLPFDTLAQMAQAEGFPVEDIRTFIDALEQDLTYKTTGSRVYSKSKQYSDKELAREEEEYYLEQEELNNHLKGLQDEGIDEGTIGETLQARKEPIESEAKGEVENEENATPEEVNASLEELGDWFEVVEHAEEEEGGFTLTQPKAPTPKKPEPTQLTLVESQPKVPTTGIRGTKPPVSTEELELVKKPKEAEAKKAQKELPTGEQQDLSKKSLSELVNDAFDIINEHLKSERGSFSTEKVDQTIYDKLKPIFAEIARRAKEKMLDVRSYLFGAVDAQPEGKAKEIYEAAARQYADELPALEKEEKEKATKEKTEKAIQDEKLPQYFDNTGERAEDDTEYGNKRPEKNFKKALKSFAKQINSYLNWEPELDKKGKDASVDVNVPPAGGYGHILLWEPNSNLGIYINFYVDRDYDSGEDALKVRKEVLIRATTKKDKWGGFSNDWIDSGKTAKEFAERAKQLVDFYDIDKSKQEALDEGHTEEEIADAVGKGEAEGEAAISGETPEEIQESIEEEIDKTKEELTDLEEETKPTKTPYDFGKEAFEHGLKASPASDKEFMDSLKAEVGGNIKAFQEWHRGWHEANLKAPVTEHEHGRPPQLKENPTNEELQAHAELVARAKQYSNMELLTAALEKENENDYYYKNVIQRFGYNSYSDFFSHNVKGDKREAIHEGQSYVHKIQNKDKKTYAFFYQDWILRGRKKEKEPQPSQNLINSDEAYQVRETLDRIYPEAKQPKEITSISAVQVKGNVEGKIGRLLGKLGLQKTILEGEDAYYKVINPPYQDLVIERHPIYESDRYSGKGDHILFTHYYKQNGDLIMDGEMVYKVHDNGQLELVETAVPNPIQGGELRGLDKKFANMFAQNLLNQGFGDPNKLVNPRKKKEEAQPVKTSKPEYTGQVSSLIRDLTIQKVKPYLNPDNSEDAILELIKREASDSLGEVTIDLLDNFTLTDNQRDYINSFNKNKESFAEAVLKEIKRLGLLEKGGGQEAGLPLIQDFLDTLVKNYPSNSVAQWVHDKVRNEEGFTWKELFEKADEAFQGTQAQGKYSPKDAYDAMELGVNKAIKTVGFHSKVNAEEAIEVVKDLKDIIKRLPTQTKRAGEQDEFQQFSTPPPLAFMVNWVANVNKNDTVLEPSAGTGDLAIFAKNAGAKVIVNELSKKRLELLKQLPFDKFFNVNAEQLNNMLPEDVKATVVVMNPPFSSTAGRTPGKTDSRNIIAHIEQALKRLEPNGRLVLIAGKGLDDKAPTFRDWFKKIGEKYNVRAMVDMNGYEYMKYGTTFDNRIIIIDNTGKSDYNNIVRGKVDKTEDLIPLLTEVRNDRPAIPERNLPGQQPSNQPTGETGTPESQSGLPGEPGVLSPTGTVGARPGGGQSPTGGRPTTQTQPGSGTTLGQPARPNGPSSGQRPGGQQGTTGVASQKRPGQNAEGTRGTLPGFGEQPTESTSPELPSETSGELSVNQKEVEKASGELSDSLYENYRPERLSIAGAQPHPAKLVQSAAMAAVPPPAPTYKPRIPDETIKKGLVSLPQIEAAVYAGQSFETFSEDGRRNGFFIGDGTGVGKGREISTILWDNWHRGRKRAVWISQNDGLLKDAQRDVRNIGWDPELIFPKPKKPKEKISVKEGILFTAYSTLGQGNKERFNQLVDWLGEDFDGVIVFDESHNLGNAVATRGARGASKPSLKATTGVELQDRLPNARILTVSATGASKPMNLAYQTRLGLWGEGTCFPNVTSFINSIEGGGLATMEIVARDLKARGLYVSRTLSFDDVTHQQMEHNLTPDQVKNYDKLAEGWQLVLRNIHDALQVTGQTTHNGARARGAWNDWSHFWGTCQRFFNQVVTSMQTPTMIQDMEEKLAKGESCVIQLVNTNEAALNRGISELEEGETLEDLDISPIKILLEWVDKGFPVQQYEIRTDDNGNEVAVPLFNADGTPVLNREAVAMKNRLLTELGSLPAPDNPLDLILNHFGTEKVGEVSGRSRRLVKGSDGSPTIQPWSKNKGYADVEAFMNGKKKILVFTDAGGTGASYDADRTVKNQTKRNHYLLQAGWRAENALQGFGRTHRSNEAQAPHYVLLTTNLHGQKRFISSIARRLDQLGALTKGSRQTGSQGFFQSRDNLESAEARDALRVFFRNLYLGEYPEISLDDFQEQTGLELVDRTRGGLKANLPEITQFLNRLLNLKVDMMNKVFDRFQDEHDQVVESAIANGTLDQGVETIRAEKIEKASEQTVYTDPKSQAETKYVQLDVETKTPLINFENARNYFLSSKGFFKNVKSGRVWCASDIKTRTNTGTGSIEEYHIMISPAHHREYVNKEDLISDKWIKIKDSEAKKDWDNEFNTLPPTQTRREHIISGMLLPIWDRLQGRVKVVRVQTAEGEKMIGRRILPADISRTLKNLGAERAHIQATPEELFSKILNENYKIELANGWEISRARVSNENRIEIDGPDYAHMEELENHGVFVERIGSYTRWFIPTGEKGVNTFKAVIKNRPVIDLVPPDKVDSPMASRRLDLREVKGIPVNDINNALEPILSRLKVKPKVTVLKYFKDLPVNIKDTFASKGGGLIGGVIDPAMENIYIIAENTPSIQKAQITLLHELYGHYGAKELFGDQFEPFLQKIYLSYGPKNLESIAKLYGYDLNTREGRLNTAAEKLALMAETNEKPSILQQVYQFIRSWLRRMGFGLTLTDQDLKDIISKKIKPYLEGKAGFGTTRQGIRSEGLLPMASQKAPTFYSQMQKVLVNKLPNKVIPQQGTMLLNTWANRGEFKKEELEWSGVKEWLAEQKGQVTKEQLIDFLKGNQIEIREVGKGGEGILADYDTAPPEVRRAVDEYNAGFDEMSSDLDALDKFQEELDKQGYEAEFDFDGLTITNIYKTGTIPTKFHEHTLPGGENYRELLLTLPEQVEKGSLVTQEMLKRYDELAEKGIKMTKEKKQEFTKLLILRNEDFEKGKGEKPTFQSPHWNEPNVLAHVRMNDRTDADGKRVLFLEEIQSDWHQEGKKQGYLTEQEKKAAWEKFKEFQSQMKKKWGDKFLKKEFYESPDLEEYERLQMAIPEEQVPDAPFKTTWPLLAVKRMIRWAAENGYDKIAWTTGEQQAERYDLSKQINVLRYTKYADGIYNLFAIGKNGENIDFSNRHFKSNELPSVVGKGIADKIIAGEGRQMVNSTTTKVLSGLDLKVGGAGMKGFYDQILPAEVNKYVKKWGAKVGKSKIDLDADQDVLEDRGFTQEQIDNGLSVHSLDITPSMRQSVLMEGQPMFSRRQEESEDDWAKRILKSINVEPTEKAVKQTVKLDSDFKKNYSDYQKAANPENPESVDPERELTPEEMQNWLKSEWEVLGKTVARMKPKNIPHSSVIEQLLASPEFYQHPVLKKLVDHAIERNSLFYDNLNYLNNADDPFQPHANVTEATKALAMKGIARKSFYLFGKTSNDYKLFQQIIDQGDINAKNAEEFEEELRKGLPKFIEIALADQGMPKELIQKYKQNGIPEDVISTWKLHREAYDKALDMLLAPLKEMQANYESAKAISPDFITIRDEKGRKKKILSLQEAIAEMEQWKGSYAPRMRDIGNWLVSGYKEGGTEKERVLYRRKYSWQAEKLAQELRSQGFTVAEPVNSPPISERTYQIVKVMEAAKFVEQAAQRMDVKDFEVKAKFLEGLFDTAADMFRERGFRSHMIHRGRMEGVVKGYVEDPNERFVRYISNVSAGVAKAETAKRMVSSFFGDYDAMGERVGGVDQKTEPNVYDVGSRYIEEQLRNTDSSDRFIALIKSIATFKYLGLNLRSMAVNATAMFTTVPASLHEYAGEGKSGFGRIAKDIGKALQQYGRRMAQREVSFSKEEETFLSEMERRHYADPQYAREAAGTIRGAYSGAWSKAMEVSMWAFGKEENLMRGATMLAGFRIARKAGYSFDEAVEKAQLASNRAHGIYGRATLPIYAQGNNIGEKFVKLFYTYLKFPHTYLQTLYDLKMRRGNIKAFMWQLAAPVVLGGAAAIPFKGLIIGFIAAVMKALGDDRDPEKMVWDGIREQLGPTAERAGRLGVTGLAGVDLSGSLSIGVGIPRNAYETFGIAGGLAKDVGEAWRYMESQQPVRAVEKVLPTGVANIVRAQREKTTGATTSRGRRLFNDDGSPYIPSRLETVLRTSGFRSSKEAVLATQNWEKTREAGRYKETHDNILEAVRANALNPDKGKEQKINDDIAEYNDKIIESGNGGKIPFITQKSIERQELNLGMYGTNPKEVTDFRENLKQVKFAEENYNELKGKNRIEAERFDVKSKRVRRLVDTFKKAERQIEKKRARKKEIGQSETYTPEQKQIYFKLIDKQMERIVELPNRRFEEATARR